MSNTQQKARSRAYPSISIPSSKRTTSKQDKDKTLASPAAPTPPSSAPFPDSDSDLSDPPESPVPRPPPTPSYPNLRRYSPLSDDDFSNVPTTPVFPPSPRTPHLVRALSDEDLSAYPSTPTFPPSPSQPPHSPRSNSSSELSDAPESPVWPESPKRSSRPLPPAVRHRLPPCTEPFCPVRKAVRRHDQGPYQHKGKQPENKNTEFRESNPPPRVWETWRKIKAGDSSRTTNDECEYFAFLSLHVDVPGRGE
ncbi:hypothetical protein BDR22DRAFT_914147 [Usnea florida]